MTEGNDAIEIDGVWDLEVGLGKIRSKLTDWSPPSSLAELHAHILADGRGAVASMIGGRAPTGEPYRCERFGEGSPISWHPTEREAVADFWLLLRVELERPGIVWWRTLPQIRRRGLGVSSYSIKARWLVSTMAVARMLRAADCAAVVDCGASLKLTGE